MWKKILCAKWWKWLMYFHRINVFVLTVEFLHRLCVWVGGWWRNHPQTSVTLIRHFWPTIRANGFRLFCVSVTGTVRLFPDGGCRRAIVSCHLQAVRNAAERRSVHFRLFLPNGGMSPLNGIHGRGVEYVVLFGTAEVIRHAARGRRVHRHVIIAGRHAIHAGFSGLAPPLLVYGRLPGQPTADFGGQFRREV